MTWLEALPGTAILGACTFGFKFFAEFWDNASTHKGGWAGGSPYFTGNGGNNTGGKVVHQGKRHRYEYLIDNHIYGRTMQLALEAHNTEWIHPHVMPAAFQFKLQQEQQKAE